MINNGQKVEALRKAREILANNRWTRGTMQKPYGAGYAYCAVGAVRAAVGVNENVNQALTDDQHELVMEVRAALEACVPQMGDYPRFTPSIVAYNDSHASSKKDIIAVFDRAIEKLEKSL